MRFWALAVVLTLAACTAPPEGENPGEGEKPGQRPVSAASRQSPAEAEQTLASLRKIDDRMPLYEMTYTGDYDPLAGIDPPKPAQAFGCSLFATAGMFARNFDWDNHPAMVLRTKAPGKHASLSVVDMHYLEGRTLDAPLLPFDGMNDKGLAVGLAADEGAQAGFDPAKRTVGGVRVLRLILDSAATVAEALRVLESYNLDFDGGPALHYLFADRSGASAVAEFAGGRLKVEHGTGAWQALTNFPLVGSGPAERAADRRYHTAATMLERGAVTDAASAQTVLRAVVQSHTRWSAVYDLHHGRMRLWPGQDWAKELVFTLPA